MTTDSRDVCIVGAGPAGLTAGIFTARASLDTLVVRADEPILRRNAHLENVPGFPAGVHSGRFLELTRDQAERNGVEIREDRVTDVSQPAADDDHHLRVDLESGTTIRSEDVICTSWADTDYLDELSGVGLMKRGSKTYVDVEATGVPGLWAAGRIAETHHQTVVAAGDGASVALNVIDAADVPFYHDWVAPEGYFTGRGREVPPGCEEIDEAERARRERESIETMQDYFDEPYPEPPRQHPSVREE